MRLVLPFEITARSFSSRRTVTATIIATLIFVSAARAQNNACDLYADGNIDARDANLAVDMAIGLAPCSANVQSPGVCDAVTVQRVINAALTGTCATGTGSAPHSVTLYWVASSSPNIVGYNIYRATNSGGAYTKVTTSLVRDIRYMDNLIESGRTYYYVATAVDGSNNESGFSNEAQAVIPSP